MKYKGYVEYYTYRNPENGYGIFNFVCDELEDGEIKCVGITAGMDPGDLVELEGEMVMHPTYGMQIKVSSFLVLPPEDKLSTERYLASGAIKGIGAALASRIVKKFGNDTFRIMEEEPERLAEIKGISERMAREIGVQILEKRELREAMIYLSTLGISNSVALRIYDRYKADLYQIMKENPYRLAEDIRGIGFKTADEIGAKAGISLSSPKRIRGGILHSLKEALTEGHTYMDKEDLLSSAATLLTLNGESVSEEIIPMVMDGLIVMKEDGGVFLKSVYLAELQAAGRLRDLKDAFSDRPLNVPEKAKVLAVVEEIKDEGIVLDEVQTEAVLEAVRNGIFILTGGPGTGKTSTIRAIIRYFDSQSQTVALCAPTGRAAKRMEEATGYNAKTIHRLLEVNGASEQDEDVPIFNRNEMNPLEVDVVIVDEMSMVDTFLFAALLRALMPGTRLILSGDAAQLPSVGPGNVLKDLIASKLFAGITLETIYRQSSGGDIVLNADRIRRGKLPDISAKGGDFFFVERSKASDIYRDLVLLIREKIPAKFHIDPFSVQVLSPTKVGNFGTLALNEMLQYSLNPPEKGKAELTRGDTIFRVGDKVMQTKNNYNAKWIVRGINGITGEEGEGVFNGDTGSIISVNVFDKSLTVCFDDHREVEYAKEMLEELELAYAITIHKSQGSEYPAVLLPLVDGPRMLFTRNLLYTAVSRGSSLVMILGRFACVENMVATDGEQKRRTGLKERLKEVFSK
jgi:exodeoxyribonuclease V alpha subunit